MRITKRLWCIYLELVHLLSPSSRSSSSCTRENTEFDWVQRILFNSSCWRTFFAECRRHHKLKLNRRKYTRRGRPTAAIIIIINQAYWRRPRRRRRRCAKVINWHFWNVSTELWRWMAIFHSFCEWVAYTGNTVCLDCQTSNIRTVDKFPVCHHSSKANTMCIHTYSNSMEDT